MHVSWAPGSRCLNVPRASWQKRAGWLQGSPCLLLLALGPGFSDGLLHVIITILVHFLQKESGPVRQGAGCGSYEPLSHLHQIHNARRRIRGVRRCILKLRALAQDVRGGHVYQRTEDRGIPPQSSDPTDLVLFGPSGLGVRLGNVIPCSGLRFGETEGQSAIFCLHSALLGDNRPVQAVELEGTKGIVRRAGGDCPHRHDTRNAGRARERVNDTNTSKQSRFESVSNSKENEVS